MAGVPNSVAKRGNVGLHVFNPLRLDVLPEYLGTLAAAQSLSQSLGSPTAIRVQDPTRPGGSIIVDETFTVDELATVSLNEYMLPSALSYIEALYRQRCLSVWINKIDTCGAHDSLDSWDSLLVFEGIRISNISYPQLNALDQTDEALQMTGEFTVRQFYRLFPHRFGAQAGAQVLAEVVGLVIADEVSCGTCSKFSDGSQKIYALTIANGGSPGLSSSLVWTEDRSTWTAADIPTLGGASGSDLVAAGPYLIVFSEASNSHHYAPKATPQAANWAEVTTGYVGSSEPTCGYVAGSNIILAGANAGYVYKITTVATGAEVVADGTNTTEDANDIHGIGTSTIVVARDANTLEYSTNAGETFSLVEGNDGLNGPENGADLTAVAVLSDYQWYVGTSTGKLWYTGDRGATWAQRELPNQGTISRINDIQFSPGRDSHGYIACTTDTGGKLLRTYTRGLVWQDGNPALSGVSTNTRLNKVVLGDVNVAITGGVVSGGDGIILVASN